MRKTGGVYEVPVTINGILKLNFIVDSGAAEVFVPSEVFMTLLHSDTLSSQDFLPGKTYVLADGSKVKSQRFIIRRMKVGSYIVKNVTASISPPGSSLLIGQSFLEKVGKWRIDSKRQLFILGSSPPKVVQRQQQPVLLSDPPKPSRTIASNPTEDAPKKRRTRSDSVEEDSPTSLLGGTVTASSSRSSGSGRFGDSGDFNPDRNSPVQDVDWVSYLAVLKSRVQRNWINHDESGNFGCPILNFSISRSGEVSRLIVMRSSGSLRWDNAAMKAVLQSAPFDPLPSAYRGDDIVMGIDFKEYNSQCATPTTIDSNL
jgi:TonB family protein